MDTKLRMAGQGAIAGGLLWIAAIIVQAAAHAYHTSDGTDYYVVQVLAGLGFIGLLLGVHGVGWARAAGAGRFGRWSLRAFEIGVVLLILGTFSILVTHSDESPLFPLGGLLIGIAGTLTGVAVVRTAAWSGWQRYAPLTVGLFFIFGMLIPVIANSNNDGPPAVLQAVWGATWLILGLAYLIPSYRSAAGYGTIPELTGTHS